MGPYDRETKYRIEGNYCYIYIKNGDFEMKCDIDKMEILKGYVWNCTKGRLPNISENGKQISMAKILFPEIRKVAYKDGNSHNLTKENIIEMDRKCYIKDGLCYIPLYGGAEAICDMDKKDLVQRQGVWGRTPTGLPVTKVRGDNGRPLSLLALLFPGIQIAQYIDGNRLNFTSKNVREFKRICYIKEDICYVPMTNNDVAICDAIDIEKVQKYNWCRNKSGYPMSKINGKSVEMHRYLYSHIPIIDHINRNKLDNRACNIRPATKVQNGRNRSKFKNNTTGYKGVAFDKDRNAFSARISYGDGKSHRIGRFLTAIEAAKAYDTKAKEIYGEFAVLNFPEEIKEQSNG